MGKNVSEETIFCFCFENFTSDLFGLRTEHVQNVYDWNIVLTDLFGLCTELVQNAYDWSIIVSQFAGWCVIFYDIMLNYVILSYSTHMILCDIINSFIKHLCLTRKVNNYLCDIIIIWNKNSYFEVILQII